MSKLIKGFSLKRAVGISSVKQKIARTTGIPTTKAGRKRKVASAISKGIGIDRLIK